MPASERCLPGLLVALVLSLTGCGADEPDLSPLPDGVTAVADQTRLQRQGREVFVRIANDGAVDLQVDGLELTSDRTAAARSTRGQRIRAGYEGDVELELPRGECGKAPTFAATLEYRVDGERRRSRVEVDDRYGALTRILDADCVAATLDAAGDLAVGDPRREGDLLRVPVTFTPSEAARRGAGPGLTLVGYRGTPLVRPADGSAADVELGTDPLRIDLVLAPARCDAHAIAEDKVGRLIPVEIRGADLPDGATFTLPLTTPQKAEVTSFVRAVCGLD